MISFFARTSTIKVVVVVVVIVVVALESIINKKYSIELINTKQYV